MCYRPVDLHAGDWHRRNYALGHTLGAQCLTARPLGSRGSKESLLSLWSMSCMASHDVLMLLGAHELSSSCFWLVNLLLGFRLAVCRAHCVAFQMSRGTPHPFGQDLMR